MLGKAFFAEATAAAVPTITDIAIGGVLYGETIAGGLLLSYATDVVISEFVRRDDTPPKPVNVAIDFILEWTPIEIPMNQTYVKKTNFFS